MQIQLSPELNNNKITLDSHSYRTKSTYQSHSIAHTISIA